MRARPVVRAVSGGLTRRKVQTVVIFTVLLVSTASATLGLGLLVRLRRAVPAFLHGAARRSPDGGD